MSFLSTNWMENKDLLNQYPSLIFWICRNKACSNRLIELYQNFIPCSNQIPLWVLCLRIMSSKQCIILDVQSNNQMSNVIKNAVSEAVIKYLNDSMTNKKLIDYDWINLLITDLPPKIVNNNYKIIHDFFAILSLDNIHNSSEIKKLKYEFISGTVYKMTSLILEKKINDILLDSINGENSLTQFLAHPSDSIQDFINYSLTQTAHSIIEDDSTKKFLEFIKNKENLSKIITNLKISILEDENKMEKDFHDKKENDKRENRNRLITQINEKIIQYNSILNSIANATINYDEVNDKINTLLSLREYFQKNYQNIFSGQSVEIRKKISSKSHIYIERTTNASKYFKIKNKANSILYLLPGDEISSDKNDIIRESGRIFFKYIKNEYLDNLENIEKIIKDDDLFTIQSPFLIFGPNKIVSKSFIELVNNLKILLDSFESKFFDISNKDLQITEECFQFINSVGEKIEEIKNNSRVEFNTHASAQKTQEFIQADLKKYLDILHELFNEMQNRINKKLYPLWKELDPKLHFEKILEHDNEYDIKIPKIDSEPPLLPDFSTINNFKSLAYPIICFSPEKDQIICSIKKLVCIIEPIFPSLVNKAYISLLSFIDEETKLSIENLSNPQFNQIISVNDKISNKKDSIQIAIYPPSINEKEPEIIQLVGNLKIEAGEIQPFSLPFDIKLKLIPLKVVIKCNQYQLSKENNEKCFRLCSDKVESDEQIDFEIINYYVNDKCMFKIEFQPLEGNQSERPSYISETNSFSVILPQVKSPTCCKFNIIVMFSNNFEKIIHCDFVIMPIIFIFEIYDVYEKKFVSDKREIIISKGYPVDIYYRVLPLYPIKHKGKMNINIPNSLKTYELIISGDFDIQNEICSKFTIIWDKESTNENFEKNCDISFEVKNIKKTIKLDFIAYKEIHESIRQNLVYGNNGYYLNRFPVYIYNNDSMKWIRIHNVEDLKKQKELNSPYILTTPFGSANNFKDYSKVNYHEENCNYVTVSECQDYIIEYLQISAHANQHDIIMNNKFSSKREIQGETYYTIIGNARDHDLWFPAFDEYPDIKDINELEYEIENAQLANDNINRMFESINANKKFYLYSDNSQYDQTNFSILMNLLKSKSVIINIMIILSQFPESLQNEFIEIKGKIQNFVDLGNKLSDEILAIISHNLILRFAQVLSKRYIDLKMNLFCLRSPLDEMSIGKEIYESYLELIAFDDSIYHSQRENINELFYEIIAEINDIYVDPLPKESKWNKYYVISENDDSIPWETEDGLGTIYFEDSDDQDSQISDTTDAITSLPTMQLPNNPSIQDLCFFYSQCSLGATVLPTYVLRCRIKKLEGQTDSQIYFAKLYSVYSSAIQNKSIISGPINRFIESFQNCTKRLKKAGVNFDSFKILKDSLQIYNNLPDYIWIPKLVPPNIPEIKWYIENSDDKSHFGEHFSDDDDGDFEIENIHVEESETKSIENKIPQFQHENNDSLNVPNANISPKSSAAKEKISNLISEKVALDDSDYSDFDENEDEDEDENNNLKNNKDEDDKPVYLSEVSDSKRTDIQSNEFDKITEKFNENDIIQLVINRVKTMDKNAQLDFSNFSRYIINNKNDLFSTKKSEFPVKELIENSQYLIEKLVVSASSIKCPVHLMSCNLLIDCSFIINVKDKLYNFMLLTSFAYALKAIEIPFSISIIADEHFRFVLKSYEEDLNAMVLQRVLDCLFVKRYRANIADTINYSIKSLICPERSQRSFFIFSDGLDENFVLTNSWKELLLNNSSNSFGMIFIKPKHSKIAVLENMWDNFIKMTKSAKSITRLIYINADTDQSTLNSIIQVFTKVLSRPIVSNKKDLTIKNDNLPIFIKNYDVLNQNTFKKIKRNCKDVFGSFVSHIFIQNNQIFLDNITNFEKLDVSHYLNKTAKITFTPVDESIKKEFDFLIHDILFSKKNVNKLFLETIFKPNKPSQTVLSNTGTDFDITELIKNLINPVPDPFIYLEEKGGLIRNYGVTIIIDSSISCFEPKLSSSHSYQTIKVLFSALYSIDIPCVDVIIATNDAPIVLCSETPSLVLFNEKSHFWPSFFTCLLKNHFNSCKLESAIHAAYDLRRMRSIDSKSYMFVLSDGFYQIEQQKSIKNHLTICEQSGFSIFGIGIGIYPIGIKDLFPHVIYSPNPNNLIEGISQFFDDEYREATNDIIEAICSQKKDVKDILIKLIENEKNPVFNELKNYLQEIPVGLDIFSHAYNKEQVGKHLNNMIIDPKDKMKEMYVENFFKGQKILIVMPYDCNMNFKENPKVAVEFLSKSDTPDCFCIKQALDYYGIEMKVVQNYKDAILALTNQTEPGKCDYYATWVLSGLPYDYPLADGGNQHLVMPFIQCLLQFWEKGGAVVLFGEGDPLTFQLNLFLQELKFPDGSKVQLRFGGSHKGTKILEADETGMLDNNGTFNKAPNKYARYQRSPLGHNLTQIYEGETTSYAPNDKDKYFPFVPFMRDSEGGLSALFYPGDKDQKHRVGDILVCGTYTNFFDKMDKEGTFRFIQNIAAWTTQYESRFISEQSNRENIRPKAIYFDLDESVKFDGFSNLPPEYLHQNIYVDPRNLEHNLFAIDKSWSVGGSDFYYNYVKNIINDYYKPDDIFMKWDSTAEIVSKNEIEVMIRKKKGLWWTYPSSIAKALANHHILNVDHLIIITDGKTNTKSVRECDKLLRDNHIKIKYVTAYIITNDDKYDLSVGSSFSRNCGSVTYVINKNGNRREYNRVNGIDFSSLEAIDQINDVNGFDHIFKPLFNAVKMKMMGNNIDPDLQNKLKRMEQRILKSSGEIAPDIKRKINSIIKMASGLIENIFDNDQITAMNF